MVIVFLIILLIWLFAYYKRVIPAKAQLRARENQLSSLRQSVNRLRVVKAQKKKFDEEFANVQRKLSNVQSKLPKGKEEVGQIIRTIVGNDAKIRIDSIVRKNPINKKYYVEVPYVVSLSTNYPSFVEWCDKLMKANRIINFGNISINSYSEKGKPYTIKVNLIINAYNLKG